MAEKCLRTCVACGAASHKRELVRLVRNEGGAAFDPGGNAPGRGAYVCPRRACLDAARKRRALDRALRTKIDGALWERLEQEFDMLCASHSDAR